MDAKNNLNIAKNKIEEAQKRLQLVRTKLNNMRHSIAKDYTRLLNYLDRVIDTYKCSTEGEDGGMDTETALEVMEETVHAANTLRDICNKVWYCFLDAESAANNIEHAYRLIKGILEKDDEEAEKE